MLHMMFCTEIFLFQFPGGQPMSVHRVTSILLVTGYPGPCCDVMRTLRLFLIIAFHSNAKVDILVHWCTSVILFVE